MVSNMAFIFHFIYGIIHQPLTNSYFSFFFNMVPPTSTNQIMEESLELMGILGIIIGEFDGMNASMVWRVDLSDVVNGGAATGAMVGIIVVGMSKVLGPRVFGYTLISREHVANIHLWLKKLWGESCVTQFSHVRYQILFNRTWQMLLLFQR